MLSTAQAVLQNGKYSLDAPREGLFELTYPARNESERVIITTLAENLRSHPEFERFKQQFLNTSQRLSRCQHPNLPIIDYFEESGLPYLVLESVEGQTLAELINPATHPEIVSEIQAIKYIRQVGEALSALHQANLIHQDVKPENIIRRQNTEDVILTNLSLVGDLTPGIRQTHAALISPGYASPEQYQPNAKLTTACDIYALAATLAALLTGEPPIPAPIRMSEASPSEFRSGLPTRTRRISPQVEQAILRGLELEAGQRPQIQEWLALLPNEPVAETNSSQLLFLTPPQPLKKLPARAITTPVPSKRSPWLSLAMTGAVAASAGIGFGLAIRTHQPTEPGSTIFHQDQSFPPRNNWPISDFTPSVEERGGTEGVGSRE